MANQPGVGVDETGREHGVWRVAERDGNAPGYWFWRCACRLCGFERVLSGAQLRAKPPRCRCQGGRSHFPPKPPTWKPSGTVPGRRGNSEPHSAAVIRSIELQINGRMLGETT